MIDVPVYNESGDQIETVAVDEDALGGKVRPALLKQAVVAYLANQRQGSAATRSRGMIVGSTAKLYRQKGTGRARVGNVRTAVRRGGGVAFAKRPRDFRQAMPKKMRRLARNNAVLAKILTGDLLLLDELLYEAPKTHRFAKMLRAIKADTGCLVAVAERNMNIYKSGRNIPRTEIRPVDQLNAYEVMRRNRLVMTKDALARLLEGPKAGDQTVEADAAEE
ncbi:MAG: 50S ribosomal protein L4 [Phycisphaerae bacterium]|nr:50S ribosomal protein L4 [Phycisphaerae bacterium]